MNKEQFIEKARKVHGEKYDYSKVEYVGSKIKACIICPIHGEFWQIPANHLRGYVCPKCANIKRGDTFRLTQETFIARSTITHNGKYDYSKVKYVNANTKVCIICPTHGEFYITPLAHLYSSQGCPKCVGRNLSTNEIIKMFIEKHGDKYDYSKVEYKKMHEKVCIICPIHGEFWQTPSKHLLGQGCNLCGVKERSDNKRKTTEQFIEEAKKIHGDKYDYSLVNYINALKKVKIKCKNCGNIFLQKPNDHLNKHGCPKCNSSHLENEMREFLIENNIVFEEQYRPKWLGKQSLDFYLPQYNLAIECQGKQHFEAIDHFGGEKEYEQIIKRDVKKYELLKENKVDILYFVDKQIDIDSLTNQIYTKENTIKINDISEIIKG